ncbi:3-oxoacyl-ACP reductase [Leptothoe sp. LEGE 181152]|nr:3-oxoacyl-ACP reductase [Leptothoe sp. LEGE 181152]
MLLKNKVAIVTGASRGVGASIAQVLAHEGAAVCVNYLKSVDQASQVVDSIIGQGGRAFAHQADVTVSSEVEAMVTQVIKTYGRVDVVVNNALPTYKFDPTAPYTSIETVQWDNFSQQIEGTVKGVFNVVRAVVPSMKAQHFGKVINISTNLVYNPVVTYYDYTTAKAGLVGLTRNLAAELGQYGIRVNLIAGGLLRTTDASSATTDEVFELVAKNTPLRQTISVEEFAQSVLLFASDWSNAITGQSIAVDGGLTMP